VTERGGPSSTLFARVTLSEASLIGVQPPIRRRFDATASRVRSGSWPQGARELHHPNNVASRPERDPDMTYSAGTQARQHRPDALIVGAPKAGTTALHAALARQGEARPKMRPRPRTPAPTLWPGQRFILSVGGGGVI
jgi:hypothetical protein